MILEQQLLELINENEEYISSLLEKKSSTALQAKQKGLEYFGFGRWGKDNKITHNTVDGTLQPVKVDQRPKKQAQGTSPQGFGQDFIGKQGRGIVPSPQPTLNLPVPRRSTTPKSKPQKQQRFRNWQAKFSSTPSRVIDKVRKFGSKTKQQAREFFEQELHHGKTPERRSLGQTIRDKTKGAIKAIKDGAKHEMAEFRDAGRGVRSLFRGKKPNHRERHAMMGVATKVLTTALFGAALGGASHGLAAFGKHVMMEFIPHVVGETVLKGAGKAALFAEVDNKMSDDEMMEKFIELVVKNFEEMDIPKKVLEKAMMSYKGED